jgi:hypothetical protein
MKWHSLGPTNKTSDQQNTDTYSTKPKNCADSMTWTPAEPYRSHRSQTGLNFSVMSLITPSKRSQTKLLPKEIGSSLHFRNRNREIIKESPLACWPNGEDYG